MPDSAREGGVAGRSCDPAGRPATLLDSSLSILQPGAAHLADRQRLRDWLQLQATLGLRPMDAVAGLERWRDPARVVAQCGLPPALDAAALEASLQGLQRLGGRALPLLSPAYPERLRSLTDAAPLLLLCGAAGGEVALFARPWVAIVGSRAATRYGLGVARQLAGELAAAGVVVVSGLARGIDGAAHTGALEAGGDTVAIQACGLDRVYPPEHRELARRIRQQGLILSEMPLGTPPRGPYFPLRNRLISALAQVVVIVEARQRSGSLITARHALEQGREVMAVPGPINSPCSSGPNALLREGAAPVCATQDILDELGVAQVAEDAGPASCPSDRAEGTAAAAGLPQRPEAQGLLAQLRAAPATRDQLLRGGQWRREQLELWLLELELAGVVAQDRDGRYRAQDRVPSDTSGG